MFEWIIENILIKLPESLWIGMTIFGLLIYMSSKLFSYYSRLLPYNFLVKPLAAALIYSGIYMYGAKQINDIWESKIEEQKIIIESYEKASEELGKSIDKEHAEALEKLNLETKKTQDRIKGLEAALNKTLQDKKNVDKFYASLNKDQQKKYRAMSDQQKQEYQLGIMTLRNLTEDQKNELLGKNKKIEDLEKQLAELAANRLKCPTVPSLLIDQHNDATKRTGP